MGELVGDETGVLLACFTSPVRGNLDIENVLVFNLNRKWNAGADCFRDCASSGVIIERSFARPRATSDGRELEHHHRYEVVEATSGSRL